MQYCWNVLLHFTTPPSCLPRKYCALVKMQDCWEALSFCAVLGMVINQVQGMFGFFFFFFNFTITFFLNWLFSVSFWGKKKFSCPETAFLTNLRSGKYSSRHYCMGGGTGSCCECSRIHWVGSRVSHRFPRLCGGLYWLFPQQLPKSFHPHLSFF